MKRSISIILTIILMLSVITPMFDYVNAESLNPMGSYEDFLTYITDVLGRETYITHYGKRLDANWNSYKNYQDQLDYGELIYGSPESVVGYEPSGMPSQSEKNGEWRYLGFSYEGEIVANEKFPHDSTTNTDPRTWLSRFTNVSGANNTWDRGSLRERQKSYMTVANLRGHGLNNGGEWGNEDNWNVERLNEGYGFNDNGSTTYNKTYLQTHATWKTGFSVRTNMGKYYQVWYGDGFGGDLELTGDLESKDQVVIYPNDSQGTLDVNFTGQAILGNEWLVVQDIKELKVELYDKKNKDVTTTSISVSDQLNFKRSDYGVGEYDVEIFGTVTIESVYGDKYSEKIKKDIKVIVKEPYYPEDYGDSQSGHEPDPDPVPEVPSPVLEMTDSVTPISKEWKGNDINAHVDVASEVFNVNPNDVESFTISVNDETMPASKVIKLNNRFDFTIDCSAFDENETLESMEKKWNVKTKVVLKDGETLTKEDLLKTTIVRGVKPPIVRIRANDKVKLGDTIDIFGSATSPSGLDISKYYWEIDSDYKPEYNDTKWINDYEFQSEGIKTIELIAEDQLGNQGHGEKEVEVLPPTVDGRMNIKGVFKPYRKISVDNIGSDSPEKYPIVESLTDWTIETSNGLLDTDLHSNPLGIDGHSNFDFISKKTGTVDLKLYQENTLGYNDTVRKIIDIQPDEEPVADFTSLGVIYRNPSESGKATINVFNKSYSPDNDKIGNIKVYYQYDSNNDGNFLDEDTKLAYTGLPRELIEIDVFEVGKYKIYMEVTETYETLAGYEDIAVYKNDNTSDKPLEECIVEVDNIAPSMNLDISKKSEPLDLHFQLADYNMTKAELESYIENNIKPQLESKGFVINSYNIIDEAIKQVAISEKSNRTYNDKYNRTTGPMRGYEYRNGVGIDNLYREPKIPNENIYFLDNEDRGVDIVDLETLKTKTFSSQDGDFRADDIEEIIYIKSNPNKFFYRGWNDEVDRYYHYYYDKETGRASSEPAPIDVPEGSSKYYYYFDNYVAKFSNRYSSYFDDYTTSLEVHNLYTGEEIIDRIDIDISSSKKDKYDYDISYEEGVLLIEDDYDGDEIERFEIPKDTSFEKVELEEGTYKRVNDIFYIGGDNYSYGDEKIVQYKTEEDDSPKYERNLKKYEKLYIMDRLMNEDIEIFDYMSYHSIYYDDEKETTKFNGYSYYIAWIYPEPKTNKFTIGYNLDRHYRRMVSVNGHRIGDDYTYDKMYLEVYRLTDNVSKYINQAETENKSVYILLDNDLTLYSRRPNYKDTLAESTLTKDIPIIAVSNSNAIDEEIGLNDGESINALNDLATQIIDTVEDKSTKVNSNEIYITNQGEVTFENFYWDYENDPMFSAGYTLTHIDPYYFENSNGIYADSGVTKTLNEKDILTLDKVGLYDLKPKVRDNPKGDDRFGNYRKWSEDDMNYRIIVHRKPIADFTIELYEEGLYYEDLSYDLDHESEANRGIVEREWKWKKNDGNWNMGLLDDSDVEDDSVYMISLKVKDEEGAWSDPAFKKIETPKALPPMPLKLNAKLRAKNSKYSTSSIPASEILELYNIETIYANPHMLEVALYSSDGNTRLLPMKTINYYTGTKNDDTIDWDNIDYEIPSTFSDGLYILKIKAIDTSDPTKIDEKSFNVTVNTPLKINATISPNYPTGVPASEDIEVTVDVETPINITSVKAKLEGESETILNHIDSSGDIETYNKTLTIPSVKPDKNYYEIEIIAEIENGNTAIDIKRINVSTPVNLSITKMPTEFMTEEENVIEAKTSKYADEVIITLYKNTPYETTDYMSLKTSDKKRIWIYSYVPLSDIPDDNYIAEFTASTPNGNSETLTKNYKSLSLKLENLRITKIADFNWQDNFEKTNGTPTTLQEEGIHTKDFPVYRNDKHKWIKLGYRVYFEIDSTGLHKSEDQIHVDIDYYALDNKNYFHSVDIYVPNEEFNYKLLQNSDYSNVSKAFPLNDLNKRNSEVEPMNDNKNTWDFNIYLPPTAKIVKQGEDLDLINDNTFNNMLLVVINITAEKNTGATYDYTLKETDWATDDGSIYGSNLPTNLDFRKGINHGQVFFYDLNETLLDDVNIQQEW
ncbi:MAG: hypothetical protein FH761_13785 [Firmicutes bacterium]|nr:hypothetical protein [Bacillota bacterium]